MATVAKLTLDEGELWTPSLKQAAFKSPVGAARQKRLWVNAIKVQGEVTIKLYKGSVSVIGRKSNKSIYSIKKSSFESGKIFSKKYIENFIKTAAKRLRK